ncbi:MAG: fatty acid desaturase [Planctomycetaceae bacterium]|nr:fatty acid desaturase [Planctomycetaceae bacterium]MBT4844180.1 fatty acid desaturase [Planctomycetaceae bacterium]MBT5882603.1 fatty acid desaturase [Planctomycetaceae bacterium]MBT7916649.1 fatty acid desaturase [Planctomycetaceae bacterium]
MKSPKELLIASRKYASENVWVSLWHVISTTIVWLALVVAVFSLESMQWKMVTSIVLGLVHVRLFVIYHDYQHGAILKNSKFIRAYMFVFGLLTLSPPSVWKRSHNHHHKNNAKLYGASIGSYPVMTTKDYAEAPFLRRIQYRLARHPLFIGLGYVTVFFLGMCIRPLFLNPKRHWDAVLSVIVHGAIYVGLAMTNNPSDIVYVMVIPMAIAAGMGSYLFYAQHNFPSVELKVGREWTHVQAALKSSSYIRMSRLFHWFTANIGYHHIHHLNHNIPFYKLPKAMAAIKELKNPGMTSLLPWDVYKCLRLKLWDVERNKLVTFAFARRNRRAAV